MMISKPLCLHKRTKYKSRATTSPEIVLWYIFLIFNLSQVYRKSRKDKHTLYARMCLHRLDSIKIISFLTYELVKSCFYSFGELISSLEKASAAEKENKTRFEFWRRLKRNLNFFLSRPLFLPSFLGKNSTSRTDKKQSKEKVTLRNEW